MAVKHIPQRRRRGFGAVVVLAAAAAMMGATSDAMDLCKYGDGDAKSE